MAVTWKVTTLPQDATGRRAVVQAERTDSETGEVRTLSIETRVDAEALAADPGILEGQAKALVQLYEDSIAKEKAAAEPILKHQDELTKALNSLEAASAAVGG